MITGKNFNEGDQVLLYDSKLHLFSGKLKSRWTGPFIVQPAYPNGSVDLLNPNDDRVIKVNGQRAKPYVVDECLKHSDYTRVSLALSHCFSIIYIVLGVRSLI